MSIDIANMLVMFPLRATTAIVLSARLRTIRQFWQHAFATAVRHCTLVGTSPTDNFVPVIGTCPHAC